MHEEESSLACSSAPMRSAQIAVLLAILCIPTMFIAWWALGYISSERQPTSAYQAFEITSDPLAGAMPLAPLRNPNKVVLSLGVTVEPSRLFDDADAKITVSIAKILSPLVPPPGHVSLRVESDSFSVVPSGSRDIEAKMGVQAFYVATPKSHGDKKLYVYGKFVPNVKETLNMLRAAGFHDPKLEVLLSNPSALDEMQEMVQKDFTHEYQAVVDVQVMGHPTFLGLPAETWSMVKLVSGVIGLPSLIVLIIKQVLDRRGRSKPPPRIIVPD